MQTQSNKTKKTVTTKKTYDKMAFAADLQRLGACWGGLERFGRARGPLSKVLAAYLNGWTKVNDARISRAKGVVPTTHPTGDDYETHSDLAWLLGAKNSSLHPAAVKRRLARALKAAGIDVPPLG